MRLADDREILSAVHATLQRYQHAVHRVQAALVLEAIDDLTAARQGVRRPNGPQTTGPWLRTDRKNGRPEKEEKNYAY